jgi:hypothetical protein
MGSDGACSLIFCVARRFARRRSFCVAQCSGSCVVVHCGYLIVVPRPMPARLCKRAVCVDDCARVTYAAATPAVREVYGARQNPETIAGNAKVLG